LIRSILSEELARVQTKGSNLPAVKQENVVIRNDQDLSAFVKKLASLCKDETKRQELEKGHWTFSLSNRPTPGSHAQQGARNGQAARFDKGFINERQIDALDDDTEIVVAGKAVRFTPLAQDRLRQRGIRIERKAS